MVSNKCVVKGCSNSEKRKYLFPSNDLDFAIWVERAANPILHSISKEKIRKTYQICGRHFETICISPGTNKKLKNRSLPTLNLPCNILSLMYV